MTHAALPALSEWETFYVITGSAAAALTALMFVVIVLGSERISGTGEGAVRAFGSPNVVHFCAVLLVASVLSIPHHTVRSLAWCVGLVGVAGFGYAGWVALQARRQSGYQPVLSDWIWHVALPCVAYSGAAVAGGMMSRWPTAALDVVAVAVLLLLFIGIHNAWDSAVWIASGR